MFHDTFQPEEIPFGATIPSLSIAQPEELTTCAIIRRYSRNQFLEELSAAKHARWRRHGDAGPDKKGHTPARGAKENPLEFL